MIQLPTERRKVDEVRPNLVVLFGKPKSGKSTIMAAIDNNLIVDLENGYKALSVMSINATSVKDLREIVTAVKEKNAEVGGYFYKYITIDNASRLEEMCLPYAKELYRQTSMGKNFGYKVDPKTGEKKEDPSADVRTLPNGSGYMYTRMAINNILKAFKPLAETLILVAHVKEKQINVQGQELSEMSVDLAGKTGDIICGEADAIGLIYRKENSTYITFKGGDGTLKESRIPSWRGREFEVITSDEENNLTVDVSKLFK